MTIDEAIVHAREVAEEKYRDASMYVDDNGLYAREYAECRFCAEEHEQLADWLEELKDYRNKNKWVIRMDLLNIDEFVAKIKKAYEMGRTDAIDEYTEALRPIVSELRSALMENKNAFIDLNVIAQRLKEQGNERL